MPKKLVELEAVFLRERHRFGNEGDQVAVCEVRLPAAYNNGVELPAGFRLNVVGPVSDEGSEKFKENLTYRFYGSFADYENKRTLQTEKQFKYKMHILAQPHTRDSVIAYLVAAGRGHGIGPHRARALWDRFACDVLRVIREEPEIAAVSVPAWKLAQAEEVGRILRSLQASEHTMIEMLDLLVGRGLPKATAKLAMNAYGVEAPQIIRRNPYRLMEFRGCGFKRCDAMYLDLGLPAGALKRQALSAWYELAKDNNGHTWFPVDVAVRGIQGNVSGAEIQPLKAMKLAKRGKLLAFRRTDAAGEFVEDGNVACTVWTAEHKKCSQEEELADCINQKMREPNLWPNLEGIRGLSDHQATMLARSLVAPLGIFRGGPGTGKTTSLGRLVQHLQRFYGAGQIGLCSPTNKAAHRLTQEMVKNQIGLSATSIHRMLRVESSGRGGWSFFHNENRPLPYKVLIVDEGSMPDTGLLLSLFRAVPRGCMVLIVGDTNQLPPIQHGAPMRDMLASGLIPSGELTEPQRNAGRIVQACDEIRRGLTFSESDVISPLAAPPENFKILHACEPAAQIEKLWQVLEMARSQGIDPAWETQVMVAVNDKSLVSRKVMNDLLQSELNAGGEKVAGNLFRVGDKVICKQNSTYPCVSYVHKFDENVGGCVLCRGAKKCNLDPSSDFVANGEFGRVLAVTPKYTDVFFDWPERYVRFGNFVEDAGGDQEEGVEKYLVEEKAGGPLQLGYAATCHSMQGSETKIGIPLLDASGGAKMVCSREWFFTAISRGKYLTLPIGLRATADQMCRRSTLAVRKTFLSELIQTKAREI